MVRTIVLWNTMMSRIVAFTTLFLLASPISAGNIPPVPAREGVGRFMHDYANLLRQDAVSQVAMLQKEAFEKHETPIIVVTIHRMAEYDYQGEDIQPFAEQWFNEWKIGTGTSNKGVLVLVAVGDRKARIELGADWKRRWDEYCQKVMDQQMVPRFKEHRYEQGIAAGVAALTAMARTGPDGNPKSDSFTDWKDLFLRDDSQSGFSRFSFFAPWLATFLALLGAGLLVVTFVVPESTIPMEKRPTLFLCGSSLLLAGLLSWIAVAILLIFGMGRRAESFASGDWDGGGGFGGGFSGGGGASGSW